MSSLIAKAAAAGLCLGLALAVRTTIRVPVFDAAEKDVAPWLLTSLPAPSLAFAAASMGALLGIGIGIRSSKSHTVAPLWPAALAVAVFVPGAFWLAPFTASFSGYLLDLLLFVSAALVFWRLFSSRPAARFRLDGKRVALIGFFVYLALGWKVSRDVGPSGDEPHYLLVCYSLLHDGDLRVQNNYLEEDYTRFYRGKIGPHLAAGSPYSVHGVGLPLLLFPGFALAGLWGVLLTEALLAALILWGIYDVSWSLTGSRSACMLAVLGFGLTAPAVFLAVSAYPELPAALVVILVARRLVRNSAPERGRPLAWGLLIGFLPFLHVKFLPLATVLWAGLAYRFKDRRLVLPLAGGAAVMGLALLGFFYATLGSLDPTAAYGRQRVFVEGIPLGIAGLLFDQEFGLLAASPFYLLGIAGFSTLARRERLFGLWVMLILAAVALPGAAHPLWSGGSSPPARFLFPALPLLAVGAACVWAFERERGVAPWMPALLATSIGLAAAMALLPGQPLYLNARDGSGRVWEALSSSWDLTAYLPSLVRADPRSLVWAGVAALFVVACLSLQSWNRRLRLPSFFLFLLLAAWIQDLTGVRPSRELEGRWTAGLMRQLEAFEDRPFLALPANRLLSSKEVMGRVTLPLDPARGRGDDRFWSSRPYRIPAGRFRVLGVDPEEIQLCNGEGCFPIPLPDFESKVGLSQFRLRTRSRPAKPPRIRLDAILPTSIEAERSLALANGARLHGLDDGAYLDPRGFWVKKSSRAAFALETFDLACSEGCRLLLSNGGRENWVRTTTAAGSRRFRLLPWEQRSFTVSGDDPVVRFAVESETGFRPAEIDPASQDHRDLGVLIRAPAFDLDG